MFIYLSIFVDYVVIFFLMKIKYLNMIDLFVTYT